MSCWHCCMGPAVVVTELVELDGWLRVTKVKHNLSGTIS